jgi:hypothetical protein
MRKSSIASYARAAALFSEVDLVKFARKSVKGERGLSLGREARAIATAVNATVTGADKVARAA